MRPLFVLSVFIVSFFACSTEENKPAGVIPQAHKDAIERAEGVEDVLKKQERDIRQRMNEEG